MDKSKLVNFVPAVKDYAKDNPIPVETSNSSGFANMPKKIDYGSIPQQVNDLLSQYGQLGKTQGLQLPPDAIRQYKNLIDQFRQQVDSDPVLRNNPQVMANLIYNEKLLNGKNLQLPDY